MNTTTIPEYQNLDVKSSATELGVRKETVRRLVRRKALRRLPGLRRILIPNAEVQRFLEASDGAIPLKTLSRSGPEVAQRKPPLA
jgi:excisionase family DNA binding protein